MRSRETQSYILKIYLNFYGELMCEFIIAYLLLFVAISASNCCDE